MSRKVIRLFLSAILVLSGNWQVLSACEVSISPLDKIIMQLAPAPSQTALQQIPDQSRRLLALRSYLRAGSNIEERWSWTEKEIATFLKSRQADVLHKQIDDIKRHFAKANPGHEIYVHATVRSLDSQIAKWNANKSVARAADEMLAAWKAYSDGNDIGIVSAKPEVLARWLKSYFGKTRANVAAPGLSSHGKANAIDFQVMKNGKIIAAADSSSIETVWVAQEWAKKLKTSIDAAGPDFDGPLERPREPWHYSYHPDQKSNLSDNRQ